MARYVMIVQTNAVDGEDDAFNDWYDNRHLGDVLDVPGFVSAKRFVATEVQRYDGVPYKYLAIYEIETDDLAASIKMLKERAGTDIMPISDAMAAEKLVTVFAPRS